VSLLTSYLHGNTVLELLYGPLLVKMKSFVLCEHGYFEGKVEGVRKCCSKKTFDA